MLVLIGAWLVVGGAATLLGGFLASRLARGPHARPADRLFLAGWIGLLLMGDSLLLLSLVAPLGAAAGALVLAAAVAVGWSDARTRELITGVGRSLRDRSRLVGASMLVAAVALLAAKPVTWYDTATYHFAAIRWLAHHGAVRGLALLQPSLGHSSSWFALVAPWEASPLTARGSTVAGGFALLLAASQLSVCLARVASRRARGSDVALACALALLLPLLCWMAASPSPDLPALLLSVLVGWRVLADAEEAPVGSDPRSASRGLTRLSAPVLATLALTVKLSALPVAAIAWLYYLAEPRGRRNRFAIAGVVGPALLVPVLAHSTVMSGCPVYPSSVLCLRGAWTLPAAQRANQAELIHFWARWDGLRPPGTGEWDWLLPWVGRHWIAAALVGLTVVALLDLVRRERRGELTPHFGWAVAVAAGGMAFALYMAPAIRFFAGYLGLGLGAWVAVTRPGAVWLQRSPSLRPARAFALASAAVALLVVGAMGALTVRSELIRGRFSPAQLIAPPRMPTPPLAVRRAGDVVYFSPVAGDDRCWAAPLPCTNMRLPANLRLRDPARGLRAGFELAGAQNATVAAPSRDEPPSDGRP